MKRYYVINPCGHSCERIRETRNRCTECRKRIDDVYENLQHKTLLSDLVSNNDIENVCKCPINNDIMYEPILLPCGHVYNEFSLYQMFQFQQSCPVCREVIDKEEWFVTPLEYKTIIHDRCFTFFETAPKQDFNNEIEIFSVFAKYYSHQGNRQNLIHSIKTNILRKKIPFLPTDINWYSYFLIVYEFFDDMEILSKLWSLTPLDLKTSAEKTYIHQKIQSLILKGKVTPSNSFFFINFFVHIFFSLEVSDHAKIAGNTIISIIKKYPSSIYNCPYEKLFTKSENLRFQCKHIILNSLDVIKRLYTNYNELFESIQLFDISTMTARMLTKFHAIENFLLWFKFSEYIEIFLFMQVLLLMPNQFYLYAFTHNIIRDFYILVNNQVFINHMTKLIMNSIDEMNLFKVYRICQQVLTNDELNTLILCLQKCSFFQNQITLSPFWFDFILTFYITRTEFVENDAQLLAHILERTDKDYIKTQINILSDIKKKMEAYLNFKKRSVQV